MEVDDKSPIKQKILFIFPVVGCNKQMTWHVTHLR